jgi:hypothetical protein
MRNKISNTPLTVSLALSLTACGAGGGEPREPQAGGDDVASDGATAEQGRSDPGEAKSGSGSSADEAPSGLPSDCATREGDVCLPPKKFALQLCDGNYPTVALWMFAAGSPWTRGYLLTKTKAVYASTSGGSTGDMMPVDEEVIVVRHHGTSNPGGIQVSGATGAYDVVRWDGSCATIDEGALSFDPPARPVNARLIWNRIEMDVRDALNEDETVHDAYVTLKKECKGVTMGEVSKACEKADGALSVILAKHVRAKGGVPAPKKVPGAEDR